MLDPERGLYIAHSQEGPISICPSMANRHGLIAGATGTGKTVTLQVIAETFCQAGVPCFMADMKGDLSGISQVGRLSGFIQKRLPEFGIENPEFQACPARVYDVFGEEGHPMRTTISNMGPMLLSRLLGLSEVQSGVMDIIFRVADDKKLLLLDLKDLRAMTIYVAEHASEYRLTYGNVSESSVGAIQRALLSLEAQGADKFFGEPSFDVFDLLQTNNGKGIMSILAADKLMQNPKLYSTFLLWLLSDIYARLPEVGDLDKPKFVFFFDEAHTLFDDTSKALVDKIEQVVRLIRSKGVGVYFVTQNPTDIPESILGQLGNRVQHALRAYTPKDQKVIKSVSDTFRANPNFKTDTTLLELETGEALVSLLDEKGAPGVVQRAKILFPLSQIGTITPEQRQKLIDTSMIYGKYDRMVDRESAFEVLLADAEKAEAEQAKQEEKVVKQKQESEKEAKKKGNSKGTKSIFGKIASAALGAAITSVTASIGTSVANATTGKKSTKKTTTKDIANKAIKSATTQATRTLTRSILGSLTK